MGRITREIKFVAAADRADRALAILSHYTAPDPDHDEGTIESIYLDDTPLSSFNEKTAGHHLKRKIRLRWYIEGPAAADGRRTAFLEVKDRIGGGRDKARHAMAVPSDWIAAVPLHDPDLLRLFREGARAAGLRLPADAAPTVSIRYARRRFVCPRTQDRLCLDTRIRTTRTNGDRLPYADAGEWGVAVCEVKGEDPAFGPWAEDLVRAGFRARSFSKYGAAIAGALHPGVSA